jgi:hypothetical protein
MESLMVKDVAVKKIVFRAGMMAIVVFLGMSAVQAKPVFEKNGVVILQAEDLKRAEGKLASSFTASRWGMYQLVADGIAAAELSATVNGKPARKAGTSTGDLGRFYLQKAGPCVIEVIGKTDGITALRLVPACEGAPVVQEQGMPIELDARDSVVEGVMLRYEPNPKKLCLGFWGNPNDMPVWNYTVTTPGVYEVILTQGCGRGAGGSRAALETAGASLEFTVKDTGGYQNWEEISLGKVKFDRAGPQVLRVRVLKKARGIMDIRRVVLRPVAK